MGYCPTLGVEIAGTFPNCVVVLPKLGQVFSP